MYYYEPTSIITRIRRGTNKLLINICGIKFWRNFIRKILWNSFKDYNVLDVFDLSQLNSIHHRIKVGQVVNDCSAAEEYAGSDDVSVVGHYLFNTALNRPLYNIIIYYITFCLINVFSERARGACVIRPTSATHIPLQRHQRLRKTSQCGGGMVERVNTQRVITHCGVDSEIGSCVPCTSDSRVSNELFFRVSI